MSKKKKSETGSMKASAAATSPAPAPSPSAPATPPRPCATEVSATLTLPTEAVALVKKPHQPKASRLEIRLGTDCTFTGTGAFTMTPGGKLKVFDAPQDGNEITGAGLSAIPGADLTGGVTWYLEAVAVSGAFEDIELKLTLTAGGETLRVPEVSAKATCVELTIDVHWSRPAAGGDPVKLTTDEKIEPGRAVVVQNAKLFAERAKVTVSQAKPADYTGVLVLKPIGAGFDIFADAEEVPATGQTPIAADQRKARNADIDAAQGISFWVEAKTKSGAMGDGGWTVELEGRPGIEGDKVVMTAIVPHLKAFKSRTTTPAAAARPAELPLADAIDTGRFVHVQDTDHHHGRGLLVVGQVEPAAFEGKLQLIAWDLTHAAGYTEAKAGAPKVELFADEVAAAGQAALAFETDIVHDATYPADGKAFWVQGKTVSGELRDCQIRLAITDIDKGAVRANFTVVEFRKLTADIPSTSANTVRAGSNGGASNSPVNRHELIIANGAPAPDDFEDDYTKNVPLALIEGSVTHADQVKLSVEVKPDHVPVSWSVLRDARQGTIKGDHATIVGLAGNPAEPTLTPDGGDPLKATLSADAVGSFQIRPFVDGNGSGKYEYNDASDVRIDREPYLVMNLVLVRVQGINNLSVANSAAGSPGIVIAGGRPVAINSGDFLGTGNDAVSMKATVRVIGGGDDGLRGLDQVFSGWTNNEVNCPTSPGPGGLGEDVTHTYQAAIPAPPAPAPPLRRTRCFWQLNGAEMGGPVLDSGYAGQGTGGNSCTGTAGTSGSTVNKVADPSGIGERWTVENPDSPGGGINVNHPTIAGLDLLNFKFNIDFQCDLVFWTNRDRSYAPSNAPCERLYATVQHNTWNMRIESDFARGTFVETVVTPKTVTFNADPNPTRLATPVEGSGLETRLPDGLNQLQADIPF